MPVKSTQQRACAVLHVTVPAFPCLLRGPQSLSCCELCQRHQVHCYQQAAGSVLLPQYLLHLQFLDGCVGSSLQRFEDGL